MSIWVRAATPDDAASLSALAFGAKRHWGYPAEWMDLWREELTVTRAYLAQHIAFVAVEDEIPIGMCAIEFRADGCSLENVWIAPDRQRQGIGLALVTRALREAAAARVSTVRVVSDPFAEGFYRRLGAERRGELPSPMPGAPDRTLPVLIFDISPGSKDPGATRGDAGSEDPGAIEGETREVSR